MKNCLRRSPNYLLLTILGTFIFTFADNSSFILLYSNTFSYVLYCVIRQNEQLSKYGDTKSARNIMLIELKKLIEANPLFRDKLTFPAFKASRLRTLINQRLLSTNLLLFFFLLVHVAFLQTWFCVFVVFVVISLDTLVIISRL